VVKIVASEFHACQLERKGFTRVAEETEKTKRKAGRNKTEGGE
jgi:hypothetical protein